MKQSHTSSADDFRRTEARIIRKYGKLLDLGRPKREDIVLDIIESSESMEEIAPLLKAIVEANLSEDEFQHTIITLEVTVWHLAGHLKSLADAFEEEGESLAHTSEEEGE